LTCAACAAVIANASAATDAINLPIMMLVLLGVSRSSKTIAKIKTWQSVPRSLHERGLQRRAVNLGAGEIELRDAPRAADVVKRIAIEHQQVSTLAHRHEPTISETKILRRPTGRRHDHLRRRHAGLHHELHLLLLGIAEEMILKAGVGTENDKSAGGPELGHATLEDVVVLSVALGERRVALHMCV